MKLGPIVHGGLLIAALLVAYTGWTKDETKKPDVGTVAVWSHAASGFGGIAYDATKKSVKASWRGEGADRHLWGEVTRTKPTPRKPKKDAGDTTPEPPAETVTRQFPVDPDIGEEMVANFSDLKALSSLGALTEEKQKEYGLAESKDNLSVSFKEGQENLIIGSRVYGGSDRYVLHAESGKGYVISSKVLRPLDAGETSLRLKKLHGYEDDLVEQVKVDSEGAVKSMVRTEVKDEKGSRKAWAYAEAPGKADLTLDSFLDRAAKLAPVEYIMDDPGAVKIARISYQTKGGKELGYMEFFRKVPPELANKEAVPDKLQDPDAKKEKPPEIEYFIRTERTRVWGKISRLAAERFDQDVASLYEREAPPTTPVPEKKAPAPGAAPAMPGHGGHGGMPRRPGMPGMPPGMKAPPAPRGAPGARPPIKAPAGKAMPKPPAKKAPAKKAPAKAPAKKAPAKAPAKKAPKTP